MACIVSSFYCTIFYSGLYFVFVIQRFQQEVSLFGIFNCFKTFSAIFSCFKTFSAVVSYFQKCSAIFLIFQHQAFRF